MSRWPLVRLDEICEINPRIPRGQRFTADLAVSFVPMSAIDEIGGKISQLETRLYAEVAKGYTSFRNGDVLFAKITPCMENGKVAVADGLENGIGFGSTEFHVLRPSNNVLAEYVFYFIRQPQFRRLAKANFTGTAGQQRVPVSFLSSAQISLPPLPEQRRIVDILNHANSIRRLRREALEKARAMIPALFVEMFGDPIPDSYYPVKSLSEVAEVVSGVTKGRKFNRIEPIEVPYLRVANVQAGYLDLAEIKSILALPEEVERLKLMPGDVLLTEGGDFDKLGRGALWQGQVENCIHQNHVFRVRVNQFDLVPQYFVSFLQTGQAKNYFLRCAKRTTNLASINMTQLRGLPVPVPPIDRQKEFAEYIADIHALIDQQERQLAKADELMNALMARFFGNGTGMEAAA